MDKREKVIKGLECCMVGDGNSPDCEICPYATVGDDTCQTMDALFSDALALLNDRTADYEACAREIGIHTCATCSRRDCDCPIENEYSLPYDGYCHLWEGWAKECDF